MWKNFDELEESLSLQELSFILKHKREKEKHDRYFMAGIQGIDLSKNDKSSDDERLEEIRRKAAIELAGGDENEVQKQEFAVLGFGYKSV